MPKPSIVEPSGKSVSSAAWRKLSEVAPPYFLIARGKMSRNA